MKTIIKITLLSILTPLFAGAMQQNQKATQSSQQTSITSNWPQSNVLPLGLPADIVQNYILPNVGNTGEEVGTNLRSLRLANKCLRNLIDSNATSKIIIPQIARRTNLYEWETALALRTPSMQKWLRLNFTSENDDLKTYFDKHLFDQNPTQEKLKRIRFLIHCFPSITEIGKYPALTTNKAHQYQPAIVKNLIAAGMNINHCDKTGATPLMRACFSLDTSTIEILINAGADISKALACIHITNTTLQELGLETEISILKVEVAKRLIEFAKLKQEADRREQNSNCSIQ